MPQPCAKRARIVKRKIRLTGKKSAAMMRGMETHRQIIETLGRDAIAAKLGVALRRVDRARTEKALPASWFAGLCELAGHDLPRHLFSFKRADKDDADV